MVFVDGALWRASAVGGPIPTGREVRVVARQGLELEVVPLEAQAPGIAGQSPPSQTETRRAKRTQGIKRTEAH
jgi:hypothetical protein